MDVSLAIGQMWAGLYAACFLFLTSVGLSLTFGAGNFFNFAHGAFFMIGGYIAHGVATALGLPFPVAVASTLVLVTAIAWIEYRLLIHRVGVRQKELSVQLLSTYGILLISSEAVKWIWGSGFVINKVPDRLSGSFRALGIVLGWYQLTVVAVTAILATLLIIAMYFSRLGRLIRAMINDAPMLEHLGARSGRVIEIVFVVGAALAALGGAMAVPIMAVTPFTGDELIVSALIVTVVGGRGNVPGAAVAAVLLAEAVAFSNVIAPRAAQAMPYAIGLLVLAVKPTGLFIPYISDEQDARA